LALQRLEAERCAGAFAEPVGRVVDDRGGGEPRAFGVLVLEQFHHGSDLPFEVVVDVVPFDEEDESPFVGLLQVEAA
jgi:hypothetical protein